MACKGMSPSHGQGKLGIPNAWLALCVHSIGCNIICKHDAVIIAHEDLVHSSEVTKANPSTLLVA